jgi:hypothetical protein
MPEQAVVKGVALPKLKHLPLVLITVTVTITITIIITITISLSHLADNHPPTPLQQHCSTTPTPLQHHCR